MQTLLRQFDFGNEAGDDVDPKELTTYFVEQNMFDGFLDPTKRILVATAKKGVGKSALITWLAYRIGKKYPSSLIIKCRGADLARNRFSLRGDPKAPNEYIQDWMVRICTLINREIALVTKIALTDDKITVIEAAELEGFKQRNLVSCLIDRFTRLLGDASPSKIGSENEVQLLKRLKATNVWFLVDDLDATFQNTKEEQVALSTFFTACRYIAADMSGVSFRVTMRTDVWPVIKRQDESLDKVDQYVRDIVWHECDFKQLLANRIRAYLEAKGIPLPVHDSNFDTNLVNEIFTPQMPWSGTRVDVCTVLYTLSYTRPRWAIQLCKLAQKHALRCGNSVITKRDVDSVWGEYGTKRISDLVSEHKHQCPQVEELITAFRQAPSQMTRADLIDWVKLHINVSLTPMIEGKKITSPVEVAHFLYRIGFILARSQEKSGCYEHYSFDQMPDFLSSRSNNDFNVLWEIHPCYREALDIEKLNERERAKRGLLKRPRRL